jgi:hypothetical protein
MSTVKTKLILGLSIGFWASVFAQQTTNAPNGAPAVEGQPAATSALSQAALEKMGKMTTLFDGKTLERWHCATNAWVVKEGAMASTGAGRGVIQTKADYGHFRLIFKMRHVSGQPDHQACVLIFCTRPRKDKRDWTHWEAFNSRCLTAATGITGRGITTRAGVSSRHCRTRDSTPMNGPGGVAGQRPDWNRLAVAQPVGTKAVELLDFNEPTVGKAGPIAWQMHNKGLFDEYKDVRIETEPKGDRLITVEQ